VLKGEACIVLLKKEDALPPIRAALKRPPYLELLRRGGRFMSGQKKGKINSQPASAIGAKSLQEKEAIERGKQNPRPPCRGGAPSFFRRGKAVSGTRSPTFTHTAGNQQLRNNRRKERPFSFNTSSIIRGKKIVGKVNHFTGGKTMRGGAHRQKST